MSAPAPDDETAPGCVRCKQMMRFHSLQTVEGTGPVPKIMQVFACESCHRLEALPDEGVSSLSYRIEKLLLLS